MDRICKRRMRRLIAVTVLAVMCICMLSSCGKKKKTTPTPTPGQATPTPGKQEASQSIDAQKIYQFASPQSGDIIATITVKKYGTIKVKLFPNEAPKAVENFVELAEQGCYNGVKFSRIVEDYIVQSSTAQGYSGSIYGGGFAVETSEDLMPVRGALCMADAGEDGTNTSSFFFVATKASTLQSLEEPLDARYQITFSDYLSEAYHTDLTEKQLQFFYTYGGAPWLYGHQTVFGQIIEGFDVLDTLCEAKVTSKCVPNPGIFIESVTITKIE